ncbi:phiSA1p31-related protein [Streptomyces sp. 135]|uniref:phiSA1p31-related protein n=1 Tax=Streptomyces sp. 135 TaxID=2838850 RepID=UPI001CC17428|nr:phiSA1p31-related protein [Streptomyces sp. 135]
MENNTFSVGDEVTLKSEGRKVRVEFGPFTTQMGTQAYVIKHLDGLHAGKSATVNGRSLERGPKFAVGDDVLVLPLDTPGKVEAGPFLGRSQATFYVVKYASGTHIWVDEVALKPVLAARLNTFSFRGTEYDLNATYVDRDGDTWTFNGRVSLTGVPRMDCERLACTGPYQDRTLTTVVGAYGPLTKQD